MNSHFVVTTTFLVWLYFFRNEHFYFVRNMFMVAMVIALACYAAFPTAPPRLIPEAGFTDTIAVFTGLPQDSETVGLLVNKYAAVPSMHIAFSLMIAVPAMALPSQSVRARLVVRLSAARPLRDRRDRQPLLARRGRRRRGCLRRRGRRAPARPRAPDALGLAREPGDATA